MIRRTHGSRRDAAKARKTRVTLNGTDVTNLCYFADDRRGIVRMYRLDANGKKFVAGDRVATEQRLGSVRMRTV